MLTFDSGRYWTFCLLHSIGGGIIHVSLTPRGKIEKKMSLHRTIVCDSQAVVSYNVSHSYLYRYERLTLYETTACAVTFFLSVV